MKPTILIVALTAGLTMTGGTVAQAVQRMSFVCDLNGAPAQMDLVLEYIANAGIVWGPGAYPTIEGGIATGDYHVVTAGEVRSSSAYYAFTGEGEYAEFTDMMSAERFTVRFVEQPGGLLLVINPYAEPGWQGQHFCRRVG